MPGMDRLVVDVPALRAAAVGLQHLSHAAESTRGDLADEAAVSAPQLGGAAGDAHRLCAALDAALATLAQERRQLGQALDDVGQVYAAVDRVLAGRS